MATADAGRSDALLVASIAQGDASALAELYDRHADAVYRAAFRRLGDRQLAEEVLQDTYVALWNRAELFDPSAGSLLAWLATIARNRAVDRLRALGRRPTAVPLSAVLPTEEGDEQGIERTIAAGELLGAAPAPPDPEEVVEAGQLRDRIREALSGIPAPERQVLELAYYGELTQSEIAARLGWPLGTVKTRTRRALYRLRDLLTPVLGSDVAPPAEALSAQGSEVAAEGLDGPR
jgi:RNA polymerase sigma-70 factor (ECF subfamily)